MAQSGSKEKLLLEEMSKAMAESGKSLDEVNYLKMSEKVAKHGSQRHLQDKPIGKTLNPTSDLGGGEPMIGDPMIGDPSQMTTADFGSGTTLFTGTNAKIAESLAEFAEIPGNNAFNEIAQKIATYPTPISSGEQAKKLFGIEDNVAAIIDDVLKAEKGDYGEEIEETEFTEGMDLGD